MGATYGNLTLQGVRREDVVDYLSEIEQLAFFSPTINDFTVVYPSLYVNLKKGINKMERLEPDFNQSLEMSYFTNAFLAYLAFHLSKIFNCPALAMDIYDGNDLSYYLCQNGLFLDEYTTDGSADWYSDEPLDFLDRVKGGNAQKLCQAFGKEEVVGDVDKILRKPIIISGEETSLDLPLFETLKRSGLARYEALLEAPSILFASDRHEALARALGIRPCWVAGLDYENIIDPTMLECYLEFDEDDPSLEEAQSMLRKTAVEEDNIEE